MIRRIVSHRGGLRGASPRFFLSRQGRRQRRKPGNLCRELLFFSLIFTASLTACTPTPTPVGSTATQNRPLTPFTFRDPTGTPPEPVPQPAATFTPLPTPTPFTYTIQEGDTLLTIAFRFSVTVDDIMGVNPGVNPNLLSVGTNLVIPLGEEGIVLIPSPTPAPLLINLPECYPSPDGGMWCFMVVENGQALAVEGVTGEISLYAADGEILASELAFPPMDRIFSGTRLPLVAYFPPPAPRDQYVQGLLLGAFQIAPEKVRILSAEFRDLETQIWPGGRSAEASGHLRPVEVEPDAPLGTLVLVVVGYGDEGKVVGVRKWEAPLVSADQEVPFSVTVFSLGPPIVEVEVAAEYRLADDPVSEENLP